MTRNLCEIGLKRALTVLACALAVTVCTATDATAGTWRWNPGVSGQPVLEEQTSDPMPGQASAAIAYAGGFAPHWVGFIQARSTGGGPGSASASYSWSSFYFSWEWTEAYPGEPVHAPLQGSLEFTRLNSYLAVTDSVAVPSAIVTNDAEAFSAQAPGVISAPIPHATEAGAAAEFWMQQSLVDGELIERLYMAGSMFGQGYTDPGSTNPPEVYAFAHADSLAMDNCAASISGSRIERDQIFSWGQGDVIGAGGEGIGGWVSISGRDGYHATVATRVEVYYVVPVFGGFN